MGHNEGVGQRKMLDRQDMERAWLLDTEDMVRCWTYTVG